MSNHAAEVNDVIMQANPVFSFSLLTPRRCCEKISKKTEEKEKKESDQSGEDTDSV